MRLLVAVLALIVSAHGQVIPMGARSVPPAVVTGASRVFNGTNAQLTTATGYLTSSSTFTLSMWVKIADITEINSYLTSIYNGGGGGEQASTIYGFVPGNIEFFAVDYSGTNPRTGSQIPIADTNWHFVVWRKDTSVWEYNLDGTWHTINGSITFALSTHTFDNFVIGSAGGAAYGAATIADYRIYATALSNGDVATVKVCGTTTATPLGWWPMTGASPEPDSGSGNHSLTVTNATTGSGAPCS